MSDSISRQVVIEKMRNHRRLFCKNHIEYSMLSKDEKITWQAYRKERK